MNVGISVSRVGGNAQIKAMKKVAGPLKLELAQYRELESFAKFGSDLDKSTQQQLRRGARLTEILKQKQFVPLPVNKQIALIWTATHGYLDEFDVEVLSDFEKEFFEYLDNNYLELQNLISNKKELTDDISKLLKEAADAFVGLFKNTHNIK
jgi:F-type H+-transporting ATPase subunit alpha